MSREPVSAGVGNRLVGHCAKHVLSAAISEWISGQGRPNRRVSAASMRRGGAALADHEAASPRPETAPPPPAQPRSKIGEGSDVEIGHALAPSAATPKVGKARASQHGPPLGHLPRPRILAVGRWTWRAQASPSSRRVMLRSELGRPGSPDDALPRRRRAVRRRGRRRHPDQPHVGDLFCGHDGAHGHESPARALHGEAAGRGALACSEPAFTDADNRPTEQRQQPSARDRLYAAAREAAGRGNAALSAFRDGLDPRADEALAPILSELDRAASYADAADDFPGSTSITDERPAR